MRWLTWDCHPDSTDPEFGRRIQKVTFDLEDESRKRICLFKIVLTGTHDEVKRIYNVEPSEFHKVPGKPFAITRPLKFGILTRVEKVRCQMFQIYPGESRNSRKARFLGITPVSVQPLGSDLKIQRFKPIAKGGSDAWILPRVTEEVEGDEFDSFGKEIECRRFSVPEYGILWASGVAWTNRNVPGGSVWTIPRAGDFRHTGLSVYSRIANSLGTHWGTKQCLYHGLMLSITVERDWNGGVVGKAPGIEELIGRSN